MTISDVSVVVGARNDRGVGDRATVAGVLVVVLRFRVDGDRSEGFREALEEAHAVLAQQVGYVEGHLARNVDEPGWWLLQTRWTGPGDYRRALSAYDVKVNAWTLLGTAVDEPSAYLLVAPGEELDEPGARDTG